MSLLTWAKIVIRNDIKLKKPYYIQSKTKSVAGLTSLEILSTIIFYIDEMILLDMQRIFMCM